MRSIKRFVSILKVLIKSKIVLKNPRNCDLVFFDSEQLNEFEELLSHYNFFILHTRLEQIKKIYFSYSVIKYFIKNYKGNIMTAYLASLIEVINPKVVITFIDNSIKFSDVAKTLDKKTNFLAVQNAARLDLKLYKYLFDNQIIKVDYNKRFYIPNFLCFGQFEIDHYKSFGIKVNNFIKIGSLRLANAFKYIKEKGIKLDKSIYDVCLIGEGVSGGNFRNDRLFDEEILGFEKGMVDIVKYTIKFCIKHKMKLISPQKINKSLNLNEYNRVMNTYKKYLSEEEFKFFQKSCFERSASTYKSYVAMFQSNITVGTSSTLLRENLAVGRKTLSCNLLKTDIHDFPVEGMCAIKDCSYEQFEKRLLEIQSINKKDYFLNLKKEKNYILEYNEKNSTIEILKEKIDSFMIKNYETEKNKAQRTADI